MFYLDGVHGLQPQHCLCIACMQIRGSVRQIFFTGEVCLMMPHVCVYFSNHIPLMLHTPKRNLDFLLNLFMTFGVMELLEMG